MQLCLFLVVLSNTANTWALNLFLCICNLMKSFIFFKDRVNREISTDTATCLVKSNVLISIIHLHINFY